MNTFTMTMACTPIGNKGPECPPGWTSVGYTQPGTCSIGSVPGDGVLDKWVSQGYNRVCKKTVPTSGDLAVDCCANLYGISHSIECRSRGFNPYNNNCNSIMGAKCNTLKNIDDLGPNWNGMPRGQAAIVYNGCDNTIRTPGPTPKTGCLDLACVKYAREAPPNNFLAQHDYTDKGYHYPRYSYTTPDFSNEPGYYPMRTSYKPWNDWRHKLQNNFK